MTIINKISVLTALGLTAVGAVGSSLLAATPLEPMAVQVSCFPPELVDFKFAAVDAMGLAENYRSNVRYNMGGSVITRTTWERADASSPWMQLELEYTVSFLVTAVSFRDGGDVLYVAGIRESDCSDVIEQWRFQPSDGSVVLRAALSPTSTPSAIAPIGTSSPPLVLVPGILGTSGFTPTAQRGVPPAPRRKVIYEGSALGHIRSIVADPQGRFLLLQAHGDSGIYQIDLMSQPVSAPQPVFTAGGTPALVGARRMQAYDIAAAGGRAYILSAAQGDVIPLGVAWVMIRDPNNDGIFDSIEAFSSTEWVASAYGDNSTWVRPIYAEGFQLDLGN